jgi:hypothetical protein
MKKFILSVLGVAVFFIGVGALVDKAGAKFKSDDKALALIKQARTAIGGDASLAEVRSMIIKGTSSKTFNYDGTSRTETGETEIAMQLPDKFMKMVRIGHGDGEAGTGRIESKQVDVVVVRKGEGEGAGLGSGGEGGKRFVVKEGPVQEINTADGKKLIVRTVDGPGEHKIFVHKGGDGNAVWSTEDGDKIIVENKVRAEHAEMRQNELLRTTLALLLTAPEGMDVSYTSGGEGDVDGTACNIVNAEFGGTSVKLYLSKASSLPVMMSYVGHRMPMFFKARTAAPKGGEPQKDVMTFTRKIDGPAEETAEFQVRFSDYRGVGGVQLPYKWTTTVGGQQDEVFDVTSYEVNPANIAEKFDHQGMKIRMKKPADQ